MADTNLNECCSIQSVVTIDERGQMVMPKEVRDKMGIKAGDKLAVVADTSGCCVTLIKVEALSGTVKELLKPLTGSSKEKK